MGNLTRFFAASALLTLPAVGLAPANAAMQLNGLTVAVTKDGKQLVAGGDTRTILEIDPDSLAVKKRHWIGTQISALKFNSDGSILLVLDTRNNVFFYDTKTWRPKFTLRKYDYMTVNPDANLIAGVDNSYRGATIYINSLKDSQNLAQINFKDREVVAAMGFSKDGKRIGIITRAVNSKEEKKLSSRDMPKDLRDVARDDWRQRNDGRISFVRVYEAASGKPLWEAKTFYAAGSRSQLAFDGDNLVVVSGYTNAKIGKDGNAVLFRFRHSSSVGTGITPDQSLWLTGSSSFAITSHPGLATKATGRFPNISGGGEYVRGFSATADNMAIYAGTSAYRVVKIDGNGRVLKAEPVR